MHSNQGSRPPADPAGGWSAADVWNALRDHRRLALGLGLGTLALGVGITLALPDEYRSEATVVLEPYRPHAELVPSAVTTLLEDRLRVARQWVMGRDVLEPVVQQLQLFPELREREGIDAAIDALRAHLEVHPDGEAALKIAYRTPTAAEAAPVVQAIVSELSRVNAASRVRQAQDVVSVIGEQVESAGAALASAESDLDGFRREHVGQLPDEVESNLREAERASRLLDGARGVVHALERGKLEMAAQLPDQEVDRLSTVEADIERQLNHAKAIFAEAHPEPGRLQRELEGVRSLLHQAKNKVGRDDEVQAAFEVQLRRTRGEINQLEGQIARARTQVEASPRWAAPLLQLVSVRDGWRDRLQEVRSRLLDAELSLELERRAAPLATRVTGEPVVPRHPAFPDRPRGILLSLVAAMGISMLGALTRYRTRTTVDGEDDLHRWSQWPVMGSVPENRVGGDDSQEAA